MKILCVYGTRPEYLKIKPLFKEFDKVGIEYKTLNTGQHTDLIDEDIPNYRNSHQMFSHNRLNSIVMNSLHPSDRFFNEITHVLVQGDTSSALGYALQAFHRKIKLIHLEAGLRTYDSENPYPEETNRRLISQLADIHLCPTDNAYTNLTDEMITGEKYVVGNTILDGLVKYKKDCEYTDQVLVTLHRRENHNDMWKWFNEIQYIAKKYPNLQFIFPMHPNPNVQKHKGLLTEPNIIIIEPLSHDKLIQLLIKVKLVITDSGGIQEEASFFNKICLTCRITTERPEALDQSTILIKHHTDLPNAFEHFIDNYEIDFECPFGDGTASRQIARLLKPL